MRFDLAADSLIGFDSLLFATTGQARDTSAEARPLGGRATGRVELAGSLDSLLAEGAAEIFGFEWQRFRAPHLTGSGSWLGGRRPRIAARVGADTLRVRQWVLAGPGAAVSGWAFGYTHTQFPLPLRVLTGLIGALWSWAYARTGNLLAPYVAHELSDIILDAIL